MPTKDLEKQYHVNLDGHEAEKLTPEDLVKLTSELTVDTRFNLWETMADDDEIEREQEKNFN